MRMARFFYPFTLGLLTSLADISAATQPSYRAITSTANCTGVYALSPKCSSPETGYQRDFFYIGGHYWDDGTGNRTTEGLYVEKLTPLGGVSQSKPIVFFHGGGTSGVSWLNTPDNRKGFASYFIDEGYQVYIVDQVSVGRTTDTNLDAFGLSSGTTAENAEKSFTGVEYFDLYPQAALHTQWPGIGLRGYSAFEQFQRTLIPYSSNSTSEEHAMRASGCELLSIIGPSYTISHSAGAIYPILLSNDCGQHVAGNINLESATTPFYFPSTGSLSGTVTRPWGLTNTPIDYVPAVSDASELVTVEVGNSTLGHRSCYLQKEPARQLPKIAAVKYLLITSEASVHATYDHCIIAYLNQTGGSPDWIHLAERGIHGNGHFMHLEKNNQEIADVVLGWIESTEGNSTVTSR